MAFSEWWSFTEGMVKSDRNEAGVYQFANSNGTIIYVGSSGDVKTRLQQHLSDDAKSCIKKNAAKYRIEYRSDYKAEEKRLYDAFVKANGAAPQCNDISP